MPDITLLERDTTIERAAELRALYGHLDGLELLEPMIRAEFAGGIALVSSFGAEAAVLLDLVAEIDRSVPVLFVDTRKLFGETLRYRDRLIDRLGLSDVRTLRPTKEDEAAKDPAGNLWLSNPDACCAFRKVAPLKPAIAEFDAWISGRKRYQGQTRSTLSVIEADGRQVKINPLAPWSRERLEAWMEARDLPHHPLEEDGYLSIGCMPCTDRVAPGEDIRAGRWRGRTKTECGIHMMGLGEGI